MQRGPGGAWGQTMRVRGGWIVEVDGGNGPDNFARRVRHAGRIPPSGLLRTRDADGRNGASYYADEVIASATEVARLLWGWVHRGLPAGFEVRELQEGVD